MHARKGQVLAAVGLGLVALLGVLGAFGVAGDRRRGQRGRAGRRDHRPGGVGAHHQRHGGHGRLRDRWRCRVRPRRSAGPTENPGFSRKPGFFHVGNLDFRSLGDFGSLCPPGRGAGRVGDRRSYAWHQTSGGVHGRAWSAKIRVEAG
jgi:hypothetical protein